jgi:hypothetical protein
MLCESAAFNEKATALLASGRRGERVECPPLELDRSDSRLASFDLRLATSMARPAGPKYLPADTRSGCRVAMRGYRTDQ